MTQAQAYTDADEAALATEMQADRPKVITGQAFLKALLDAGIISREDRVRRVVIDADVNGAVVVHVERYGDTRLLSVVRALEGVEVRREESA